MVESQPNILFFDGECVMCNSVVEWLVPRDPERHFQFASLQSETADVYRVKFKEFPTGLDTFVLVTGDRLLVRSRAAFAVAQKITFPWRLGAVFRFLPTFLTDTVYRFIARNRIKWFGSQESCWLAPVEEMDRFLP